MSYLLISLLCLNLPLHNYLNCTLPLLSIPLQTLPKKQLRPVPSPCPASQSSHNHYLFSSFTYATFSPWPTFLSLDLFSFPFHWQIFFTSTYFHFSLTHFLFIDPFFSLTNFLYLDPYLFIDKISFHWPISFSLTDFLYHFLFFDPFSLPWPVDLYESAPPPFPRLILPTPSSRIMRSSLRRQRRQASSMDLCPYESEFIMPRVGLNNKGDWMFLVNLNEVSSEYTQLVESKKCLTNTCTGACNVPDGFTSVCQQQYVQKRLIALDASGMALSTDTFWFPSCCVCKLNPIGG